MTSSPPLALRSTGVVFPTALCRSTAAVGLALLCATAGFIAWRWLAGALTHPLSIPALTATTMAVAAAVVAVRVTWCFGPQTRALRRQDRAVMLLTSLAAVTLLVGLCLPGVPLLGLFIAGFVLLAEELWAWSWLLHPHRVLPDAHRSCDSRSDGNQSGEREPVVHLAVREIALPDTDEEFPSDQVLQQLTRYRADNGAEELSGWLRMPFATGQRTGNLHVAFCPPFASTPELLVEQIDGPEARIKMAQVLPYGARLDLKLATVNNEPTSVLVQFSARAAQNPPSE